MSPTTKRTLTACFFSIWDEPKMVRTFIVLSVLLLSTGAAYAQRAPAYMPRSSWFKHCEKGASISTNEDGKELSESFDGCLTGAVRIDANSGMVIVGTYLYKCRVDERERPLFRVVVPLGVGIQPGVRITLVPPDSWQSLPEKLLDQTDIAKLGSPTLKLDLKYCQPKGCIAEIEATSDLLRGLKSSGGLLVSVANKAGVTVTLRVPLTGFAQTWEGAPRWSNHARKEHKERLREQLVSCAKGDSPGIWP